MTLYSKFKTYSLDPNKISVVKYRLHPNRRYVVVRNGVTWYVGGTYEDAVKEINKWGALQRYVKYEPLRVVRVGWSS